MIFSILKSIETGEKWIDAIDVEKFIIQIVRWLISSMYGAKIPYETYEHLESLDFKEIRKIANKEHKNGTKSDLKPFYESLCKMYPAEFDILDFSFKRPHAILEALGSTDYFVFEAFSSDLPEKIVYKVTVSNPEFADAKFSVIVGTQQKVDEFLKILQKQTHWRFDGKTGVTVTEIVYQNAMFGQDFLDELF